MNCCLCCTPSPHHNWSWGCICGWKNPDDVRLWENGGLLQEGNSWKILLQGKAYYDEFISLLISWLLLSKMFLNVDKYSACNSPNITLASVKKGASVLRNAEESRCHLLPILRHFWSRKLREEAFVSLPESISMACGRIFFFRAKGFKI